MFKKIDNIGSGDFAENMSLKTKSVSWNFRRLRDGDCGTIEFRRPPGIILAADAHHWIAFTLGFISGAIATDWNPYYSRNTRAAVTELQDFIMAGVQNLNPPVVDGVPGNFGLMLPVAEIIAQATAPTAENWRISKR